MSAFLSRVASGLLRGPVVGLVAGFGLFSCSPLVAGPEGRFDYEEARARIPAPDFRGPLLGGGTVNLADYRGRVLLINFWATYCNPCREEMPSLDRLQRAYPDELSVLTVVVDAKNVKGIKRFLTEYAIQLPVLLDNDGQVNKDYSVRMLPTTYVVARDGRVSGRLVGFVDWETKEARALIKRLVAGGN